MIHSRPAPLLSLLLPVRLAPLPTIAILCLAQLLGTPPRSTASGLSSGSPTPLQVDIAALLAIGPEGEGNTEAAAAFDRITDRDASAIVPLLDAMDGASPLARNWLRGATEVIFEKEAARPDADLSPETFRSFVLDTAKDRHARELAFDLLGRLDAEAATQLVPGLRDDPSTVLRRKAVARLIQEGKGLAEDAEEKSQRQAATDTLLEALDAARDVDQIQDIAKFLEKEFDHRVDLPSHFGFLMRWHMVAPFDNTDGEGFGTVFPPEESVDLDASYEGKNGEVSWEPYATSDDYGMVDFNQPFSPLKEVTGYAFTEFHSAEERTAQLRLGCKNAWKIWLNGEFVFGRDEYHRGMRIDQYILPVQLKKGRNTLLVKACQNKEEKSWTVEWQFQLRVCDETGTAIHSTDRQATPEPDVPRRRR